MSARQASIQGCVREMLRPRTWGPGVKSVRMLQTHTSWVFLTGEYAYKVKKPVNFGFLDYTTLSARRFFCLEEFRLNCQLSPDIYVAVLPITVVRGRPFAGGRGRVIDYCLKMRELPQAAIMTGQLRKGGVGYSHIDEIARVIAGFHRSAERGREVAQYGSSEIVKLNWDENFAQTMEFRGKTISYRAFDEIKASVERFVAVRRRLFQRRREGGHVRKCHGDLHSKNVFIGDRVHVFDCIEFNPRFSCCDVASEIAFMVMDLEYFGRKDLANFFVERYIVHSGDAGILRLLDFYKCYRAYVRGKVTSFNLNDPGMSAAAKAEARSVARKYFRLSGRYAASLFRRPRLVVMMGLPGTGKTYLAQKLAARIDALHLMTDSIRKQLFGIPIDARRFAGYGKGLYAPGVSRKTYREMYRRARAYLAKGQVVLVDATFLQEDFRNEARALARRAGVPVLFVHADCPERTVASRMKRRLRQGGFSDADLAVYRGMRRRFSPPRTGPDLVRVDTRQPVGRSLAKIERALRRI